MHALTSYDIILYNNTVTPVTLTSSVTLLTVQLLSTVHMFVLLE